MNKKFVGATLITATVVGGLVYYRHQLLATADKALGYLEKKFVETFEEQEMPSGLGEFASSVRTEPKDG